MQGKGNKMFTSASEQSSDEYTNVPLGVVNNNVVGLAWHRRLHWILLA